MLSAPYAGTGGCRCLDSAHGAGRNPVASGKRMRNVRSEGKKTGMQVARNPRRRSPHVAAHADFRQGSRLTVAEARSRRCKAIANRNAAEGAEQWFLQRMSMRCAAPRAVPAAASAGGGPQACPAGCVRIQALFLNEVKNLFPCEPKAKGGLCLARK